MAIEEEPHVWRVRIWCEYASDDGQLLDDACASEAEAKTLGSARARELGLDYRWNVFPQPVRASEAVEAMED